MAQVHSELLRHFRFSFGSGNTLGQWQSIYIRRNLRLIRVSVSSEPTDWRFSAELCIVFVCSYLENYHPMFGFTIMCPSVGAEGHINAWLSLLQSFHSTYDCVHSLDLRNIDQTWSEVWRKWPRGSEWLRYAYRVGILVALWSEWAGHDSTSRADAPPGTDRGTFGTWTDP